HVLTVEKIIKNVREQLRVRTVQNTILDVFLLTRAKNVDQTPSLRHLMPTYSHEQDVHLTLSEYFNNLNQEPRTSQDNSYNAITQETIFSQADLNADHTAAVNNQDTTQINLIDNMQLLLHNRELSNLLNSQYNYMQLFSVGPTQDNSPAQNIHNVTSAYFNTVIQNQLRTPQSNGYYTTTQQTIFSAQADLNTDYTTTISNQDTMDINFIDNTPLLLHSRELSNLQNNQFSFDLLNSDGYHVHQYNGMP
ncbi:30012_t:CDS:2, partial [Racocetra persica]